MPMEQRGAGGAVIQLTGNRQVLIDGCDGIVDYSPERVVLRAGRLTVHLLGRDLRLRVLTSATAVVEGFLTGVEYGF